MDLARDVVASEREEPIPEPILTAEDSAKSVEELFTTASGWEVGNNIANVRRARKALMTKGAEAVKWVIEHKIDTQDGLERRPMEDLIKQYPDTAGPLLIAKLTPKNNRFVLGNTAALLGVIKWKPAVEPLMDLLGEDEADKSRGAIMAALGEIGDLRATPAIIKFLENPRERRRLASVGALKALKDTTTVDEMVRKLGDPMFTTRASAWEGCVTFGYRAVEPLVNYVEDEKSFGRELAVNALGKIAKSLGDSSSQQHKVTRFKIIRYLDEWIDSGDRMVRAEAIAALYRNSGDKGRLDIEAKMEAEYDPVVQAAFDRVRREK
jgi:hypothetical protein